jgi:Leucine-rich repeat (LRR) protein
LYQTGESETYYLQVARGVSYRTTDAQVTWYIYKCNEIGYLNLSRNNFRGSIPAWIGSLNLLESLELGRNEFSGELPIEICELVNLEELSIYNNHIEGMIIFSSNSKVPYPPASEISKNCGILILQTT